jgi:hypothetical protein
VNLFYLDHDLDRCAEYHIDKHVTKMILEAAQLLTTTLWVDKHIGFCPRKLTKEENALLTDLKRTEPPIDQRVFTRYLPTHTNHPSAIWVRSSLEHYYWTVNYANALDSEAQWRGYKPHASCVEVNRLPLPENLPNLGFTPPTQAMPDEYKHLDTVTAYRNYYKGAKSDIARWTRRDLPDWWN